MSIRAKTKNGQTVVMSTDMRTNSTKSYRPCKSVKVRNKDTNELIASYDSVQELLKHMNISRMVYNKSLSKHNGIYGTFRFEPYDNKRVF